MNSINKLYNLFLQYRVISTDSRNVPPQSIFFALRGESFDGNKFVKMALDKGAAIAVSDNPDLGSDERVFVVEDTLVALQQLAYTHRKQLKATIIGITGSNGKTTTKELLLAVLASQFKVKATIGNLNNHIGVPLTLLSFPDSLDFGIVEMGANHIGEIAQLCRIADPEYGLITNVGKAHLEGFGSFEGVIQAKTELYKYIIKRNGTLFIHSDNKILINAAATYSSKVSYGSSEDLVSGEIINQTPFLQISCKIANDTYQLDTQLIGSYNLENILAAASIGSYFKVTPHNIQKTISSYVPVNNRSQVSKTESNTLILDAYNANPTSMEAALMNFDSANFESKVLILGEMLELGKESIAEHTKLVELVKEKGFESVYFVGESFLLLDVVPDNVYKSVDQLISYLIENKIQHRTILIKGSRGNKLEELVKVL